MKELTLEERKTMSVDDTVSWAGENVYETKSESFHVYVRPLYVKHVEAKLENGMYARDHHGHKALMSVQCASTDEGAEPVMGNIVTEERIVRLVKCDESDPESSRIPILDENGSQKDSPQFLIGWRNK